MKRPRTERRRIPAAPGQRLRRDPRAEKLPPVAVESASPSGRIRRDPRAPRSPARPSAETAPPAPTPKAIAPIVIDNPAFLILAVPDLEDGRLSGHDRDLLGAARMLADAGNGAVVVLAASNSRDDFSVVGADRLIAAELGSGYSPELKAAAVLACIEALKPRHVLFCDNAVGGGDIGRRVATSLGEVPAVHVTRLSPGEVVSRGNGGRSDYLRAPPRLLLVAAEIADPPAAAKREARTLPAPSLSAAARIEDRGIANTDPNAVPLPEADFIVSAGNGVTDWAAFHAVATALGAAEGGSRVVCDAGLLPRDRQVGASGSLVEPRCYLAFGIAGAPQHLQGILRCERVLAVNTDLHAEMVKRADLAIIADAQKVMPALTQLAKIQGKGHTCEP